MKKETSLYLLYELPLQMNTKRQLYKSFSCFQIYVLFLQKMYKTLTREQQKKFNWALINSPCDWVLTPHFNIPHM